MKTLLSLDVGTTNVKAILFDSQGKPLAMSKVALGSYHSPEPGWSEQDPLHFWDVLAEACQKLWTNRDVDRSTIQGVAITTQRATVINVDKRGNALRPAMTWMDNRRTEGLPPVGGAWGLLFMLAGLSEAILNLQAQAEANWIKKFQPEVWQGTHKFLLLSGYLNYKLSGKFVDSVGSQVGYIPFDYKRHAWASKSDWKWKAIPVQSEMLPELFPCGQKLGEISAEASQKTGIPQGLALIAAAADKACEVLGSGCLDPSQASLSFGTSATVNVSNRKYVELHHYLPPYPAAFPHGYNNEYQIFKGFWMVEWFSEQFGVPLAELENLLTDRTPGSLGLILDPYWSPGLTLAESSARGAIIGFKDFHRKEHIYQALLEGLIFRLRLGMETIQKTNKVLVKSLRVSGGGSQSDAALQITADVFGIPASRPHLYETTSLGAAINIAVACGVYKDYPAAVHAMTRVGKTFTPDLKAHAIYDELYTKVYKKILKKLLPLYQELDRILK